MHSTKKSLRAFNYLKVVVSEIRSLIGFMAAERRSTAGGPVFPVGCSHSGTSATLILLAKAPSVPVVLDESRLFLFHRSGFLHELSALVSRRPFLSSERPRFTRAKAESSVLKKPRRMFGSLIESSSGFRAVGS